MANLTSVEYDKPRDWIRSAREKDYSWETIKTGGGINTVIDPTYLKSFLQTQETVNFWPAMTEADWIELVEQQKTFEENKKQLQFATGQSILTDGREGNNLFVPNDPNSSWQLYRRSLIEEKGFKPNIVNNIQDASLKILQNLSMNTIDQEPIKGLVVGNVQSGKTANMAALMAMAADWGWNMFIILSGTIENLRQQTQKRLYGDLAKNGCNLTWRPFERVGGRRNDIGSRLQDLDLSCDSTQRFFTVCLKNKTRLVNLIRWLQSDNNKQQQLKILVIDDEADQAGINTLDISTDERNAINKLICALVNGENERGEECTTQYMAMNYIGYTATPYANFLNEASEESLYPKNFISTLGVSKEYFGPQQIFGINQNKNFYSGLNIVRTVSDADLTEIKSIHGGNLSVNFPESLEESLCWFLCCAAVRKIQGKKKPVSMLVHTSQKTDHHQMIAENIQRWFAEKSKNEIIAACESIWLKEQEEFPKERFLEEYHDFDVDEKGLYDYPMFSLLLPCISEMLDIGITNIKLGDEDKLVYSKGIHLCIDNCKHNGITEDGMYVRLAYPDKDLPDIDAPAFIIVGGTTLSRGLTIEGLTSTYFLRSVNQADTLMQMGRWFGYRKGYELFPRIWLTQKTTDQFKFLSELDQELRDEIQKMEITGKIPSQYAPRVKNTPMSSFIQITSKNRMQASVETDMDYTGAFNQTFIFDNKKEILDKNLETIKEFIQKLGNPVPYKECNVNALNRFVWRGVDSDIVEKLIEDYSFNQRLKVFNDLNKSVFIDWIHKFEKEGKLSSWNIILSGLESDVNSSWDSPVGKVNKVKRTRITPKNEYDTDLNIGVLSDPKDLVADIDLENLDSDLVNEVKQYSNSNYEELRRKCGLEKTPLLIIYIVDKDSKFVPKKKTKNGKHSRESLNAPTDLAGLCVILPGGKKGENYATKLAIPIRNSLFDDDGDLGEDNGN